MPRGFDCLIAGETNVDLLIESESALEIGKEKIAKRMDLVLGGSSSITAFNLAKLGTSVGFISVVGVDSFGQFIERKLASAGVNLAGLRRSQHQSTGLTIWLSRKQGRSGLTYPGTISDLRAKDISPKHLRLARHLHIGHYFLLKNLHREAPALFKRAKTTGMTTSLDCNFDPAEKWQSGIWKVLPNTDIFLPNQQEALELTGCASVEKAAKELGRAARIVVVKLGARGVLVQAPDEMFRMPAKKVRVVDTTGAGDSFNAGFLSRFLHGAALRDCAKAGIAAAAKCVGRIGGTAAFEGIR